MVNLKDRGPSEKYRRPKCPLIYSQNMMKTYFDGTNVMTLCGHSMLNCAVIDT